MAVDIPNPISSISPQIVAKFIGNDSEVVESNVGSSEEDEVFKSAGALEPPFDLSTLCSLFGHSNSLRPNVDAYTTNIDAFGHRFDPIIDLKARDADEQISDALFIQALDDSDDPSDLESVSQPTSEAVSQRKKNLGLEQRVERHRLETFFDFCCIDKSFTALRRETRQDIEVTGNGYWETLRNGNGKVAQFTYMPSFTIRLMPLDPEPIEVNVRVRTSPFTFQIVKMKKRFRRYVQAFQTRAIFFKELGDPRTISNMTGTIYRNEEDMFRAEGEDGAKPATEIIHFSIHNPESSYGVPRWIGTLLAVIGSRQSEEVNFMYFDNKSVPPMAIMVSGGSLSKDSITRIQDFIQNNIKGRRNFHSIMIIEAETGSTKTEAENAGRVKIDMKPLTGATHNDALFQKYDERNIDKVGMAFRMPRMLRGDIRDFNRATADAALNFAEMQVFQPERESFDFVINRRILLQEFGVKFWRFMSNAPVTRNPTDMANIIRNLSNANVLTPEIGLQLAQDVFNKVFPSIDADWAKQPIALTVAGIPVNAPLDSEGDDPVFDLNAKPEDDGAETLDPEDADDFIESAFGKADLSSGDLANAGGKQPAQSRRQRKLPAALRDPAALAKYFIGLRKILKDAEYGEAEKTFLEGKDRMRSEGDERTD